MKCLKSLALLSILSYLSLGQVYSYENQWFESYTENNSKINFSCNSQCFIIINQK
jgi:hypothetical protein